jgi:hypothetical protein
MCDSATLSPFIGTLALEQRALGGLTSCWDSLIACLKRYSARSERSVQSTLNPKRRSTPARMCANGSAMTPERLKRPLRGGNWPSTPSPSTSPHDDRLIPR